MYMYVFDVLTKLIFRNDFLTACCIRLNEKPHLIDPINGETSKNIKTQIANVNVGANGKMPNLTLRVTRRRLDNAQ